MIVHGWFHTIIVCMVLCTLVRIGLVKKQSAKSQSVNLCDESATDNSVVSRCISVMLAGLQQMLCRSYSLFASLSERFHFANIYTCNYNQCQTNFLQGPETKKEKKNKIQVFYRKIVTKFNLFLESLLQKFSTQKFKNTTNF